MRHQTLMWNILGHWIDYWLEPPLHFYHVYYFIPFKKTRPKIKNILCLPVRCNFSVRTDIWIAPLVLARNSVNPLFFSFPLFTRFLSLPPVAVKIFETQHLYTHFQTETRCKYFKNLTFNPCKNMYVALEWDTRGCFQSRGLRIRVKTYKFRIRVEIDGSRIRPLITSDCQTNPDLTWTQHSPFSQY